MLAEILAAAERETRERLAPFYERRRAWRAFHQASSEALLDSLVRNAKRTYPTFENHHQRARNRSGVS